MRLTSSRNLYLETSPAVIVAQGDTGSSATQSIETYYEYDDNGNRTVEIDARNTTQARTITRSTPAAPAK